MVHNSLNFFLENVCLPLRQSSYVLQLTHLPVPTSSTNSSLVVSHNVGRSVGATIENRDLEITECEK